MSSPRLAVLILLFAARLASAQTVDVITVDATINPATADSIDESIQKAGAGGAESRDIWPGE